MKTNYLKNVTAIALILVVCGAVGAAVNPLTGTNKIDVPDTGITLGRIPFVLAYDTRNVPTATGASRVGASDPVSFGTLWTTSLHRRIVVSADKKEAQVSVGLGRIHQFKGDGAGNFTPLAPNVNKLTITTSGYLFRDVSSGEYSESDSTGFVKRITSYDASSVTLRYSGALLTNAVSSDGRSIKLNYTNNLVDTVTVVDGTTITAAYDAAKNLASLTWQDGRSRRFVYENAQQPLLITGEIDENGARVTTWAYDTLGNVTAISHANDANNYAFTWAQPPQTAVTDTYDAATNTVYRRITQTAPVGLSMVLPNGATSSVNTVKVNESIRSAGQSQPAGSGCSASASAITYDANGNVASSDDFSGMRTCTAFDPLRNLLLTSVSGLSTSTTCAPLLQANAALPAGAKKTTITYDPDIDVPITSTGPLATRFTVINGKKNVFPAGAISNCAPTGALPDGKASFLVCKEVVQPTANADGATTPTDPYYANVRFLGKGDGANGAKPTKDDSIYGNSTTFVRNSKISTAQSKFGGASYFFPASTDQGDYVFMPGDYSLAGDFTVEMWWYPTPSPNGNGTVLMALGDGAKDGFNYFVAGPTAVLIVNKDGSYSHLAGSTLPTINQWNHLAFTRVGSNLTFYLNGAPQGAITKTGTIGNSSWAYFGQSTRNGDSYFDDVRITNGIARYTSAFTPPTAPLSTPGSVGQPSLVTQYSYDAAGRLLTAKDSLSRTTTYAYYTDTELSNPAPSGDAYWPFTSLILNADGANGAASMLDSSPNGLVATANSTASKVSNVQSKFGGASASFDGTGASYFRVKANQAFNFGDDDFTIETWLYMNADSVASPDGSKHVGIAGPESNSQGSYWNLLLLGNTSSSGTGIHFEAIFNSVSKGVGVSVSVSKNTWHHIAMSKTRTATYFFLDGVKYTAGAITQPVNMSSDANLNIGRRYFAGGWEAPLNGYLDDFRITKGVARYTDNFTPPTAPFSGSAVTYTGASVGHTAGDLKTVTNALGHVTTFDSYDALGRIRQMTDPKGVVTDISYTPRGWVSTVTATPTGGTARTTSYSYDNAGQLIGVSQPDGTSLTYRYDAAHRLIGATDAKGNSVNYTLDNVGNRIVEDIKDPMGTLQRSISRSFDALNRVQQVTGAAQ